jgi:phosphoribosylformylglycinamidine synthase
MLAGGGNGNVPKVDVETARRTFAAVYEAIGLGLIRACHDSSEGGLAVAVAEMAFAGGYGAALQLSGVPRDESIAASGDESDVAVLFSESASRFLVEVPADQRIAFESVLKSAHVPCGQVGEVTSGNRLQIASGPKTCIDVPLAELKEAWQKPLRW